MKLDGLRMINYINATSHKPTGVLHHQIVEWINGQKSGWSVLALYQMGLAFIAGKQALNVFIVCPYDHYKKKETEDN